ncbi:hypothetical protein ASE14_16010 [Agromyces sp. Root81]|uniref:PadR family transcriptional regulator n=1 Tax=Agromyces sp. Root81 TaxID=1736601 RepID=UPI0006FB6509|nr:PadR family transcriptional regulator [Agromyces sp. Root81]KRC59265.1 hypothetical protein ASE14_16010 [Agromyces sp. Root81]
MNDETTDGELLVLGLLAEQPRHGYELDRVIDERGMRAWASLGFSSIYYLLTKLDRRGLIRPVPGEPHGRRTVYELTESGARLVAERTLDALEARTPPHPRVLIGVANTADLRSDLAQARLRARAAGLRATRDVMQTRRAAQEPLPPQARAIFDYGETMLAAELDWTERLLTD